MSNDKMREAFEDWYNKEHPDGQAGYAFSYSERRNEYTDGYAQTLWGAWQTALAQQPESEPVFEIQHGPINDNDGHPKWARIESLGGWDEFNFAPGTKLYAGPPPVQQPTHGDDLSVNRFAAAMKAKLGAAREKGRAGWDDPEQCSIENLVELLRGHLSKANPGNWVDIANFCMMLQERGAEPVTLSQPLHNGERP